MRTCFFLLAFCGLLYAGCDQSIDPIVGEERPYTLWGFLDANADTQRVRVFSVEERLGVDRSGPIDAVVSSVNLTTGETRQWTGRQIMFSDSSVGHVFEAAFRARHEEQYRLEVKRSDGVMSTATVTIPPSVTVELVDERNRSVVPAFIHGKPPNLVDVSVIYDAITLPPANPWPPGSTTPEATRLPVAVSYSGKEEPTADGWKYEINLREDFEEVQDVFELNCLTRDLIALRRINFQFLAADEQWDPPNESFDPNLLIEPGTFSNVDNGYGFFGGGFTVSTRWIPTDVVLAKCRLSHCRPLPPNAIQHAGMSASS